MEKRNCLSLRTCNELKIVAFVCEFQLLLNHFFCTIINHEISQKLIVKSLRFVTFVNLVDKKDHALANAEQLLLSSF